MLSLDRFDLSAAQFQERCDEAVRRGNPYWLWPETDVDAWRDSGRRIERVTRQILLDGRATDELTGASDTICVAAFTSGMGPLLGCWAARGLFQAPNDVLEVLELHYRHNTMRMANLAKRATQAVECLAGRGVRATVLKGMQTGFAYFPAPGARPLSDMDLLVAPHEVELAGEILRGLGYLPGKRSAHPSPPQQAWQTPAASHLPRSLMLTHWDNPWYIDLQTSLSRAYSVGAPVIELDGLCTHDLLDDWALSPSAHALSPTPMVLHLACHASCGLENLMLLRLVELVLAIRKGRQEGRFSWNHFMALAQASGTLASAFPALNLTEQLCPGTVPANILRAGETQAPVAVRRIVRRLRPASAQRVQPCSLEERFMWTRSLSGLLAELFPRKIPLKDVLNIFRARMGRLFRGTLTFAAPDGF